MFLDKESRKMLDNLISGTPDYPRGTYSYDYICETFSVDEDDMFRIIEGLEEKNLVEYARWSSGPSMGVALTQAGKAYKELRRLEAPERWKERIIGFLAGVASAVLVAFIISRLGL